MSQPIEHEPWRDLLRRPSVLFLIAINMLPLIGVFLWNWDIGFLMLIYWMETVVIGLFNIPKLLMSRGGRGDDPWWLIWLGNLFLTGFFIVHYGMFNFGHFMFLSSLFDMPSVSRDVVIVVAGLSLSHTFSFFINWIGKREFETVPVNDQMFKPYGRVVIMHVAILLGGFALVSGEGRAIAPLILLIALKTLSDLMAHAVSHGWIRNQTSSG